MSEKQIKKTKEQKQDASRQDEFVVVERNRNLEILATSTKQNLGGERNGADENRKTMAASRLTAGGARGGASRRLYRELPR
jgi:hypothetical protein